MVLVIFPIILVFFSATFLLTQYYLFVIVQIYFRARIMNQSTVYEEVNKLVLEIMSKQPYLGQGVIQAVLVCCKTFCLQTSIHGFSHIAVPRRHWMERLLWVGIMGAASWCVVDVSRGQLQRFLLSPTVVTLEKDFRTWRYTLPAVTVCEQNRVNAESLPGTVQSMWNVTPADPRYQYYVQFVTTVANSDLFHLEGYADFQNDTTLDVDLLQIVLKVSGELVMKTGSSEKTIPQWTAVLTEAGVCHTTNSLAIHDIAIDQSNGTSLLATCAYSAQGCYLVFETSKVVNYYVHSPYDTADVVSPAPHIFPSLSRFTELTLTETRAGPGLRQLPPSRRNCLYTDEPTSPGRKVYSTNTCRRGCRARLALRLCGCKPFYYFYEGFSPAEPQCGAAGMRCLGARTHQLATFAGERCGCAQQCLDSVYHETSNIDQILERGPLKNRGALRLTVLAPRTRYTREIVFHLQDLVVSFGGAAGLFLGASLVSFVEIVYFLVEYLIDTNSLQKRKVVVSYDLK